MRCFRLNNAIVSVCDKPNNVIRVKGRTWRFDFDRHLGPTWLKKDGSERKCQYPNRLVWLAFEQWLKEAK